MVAQEKKRKGNPSAGRKRKSEKLDVDDLWTGLFLMMSVIKKYDTTKDAPDDDTQTLVRGFAKLGLYERVVESHEFIVQADESASALLPALTDIYRKVCRGQLKDAEYLAQLKALLKRHGQFGLPAKAFEILHITKRIIQSDLHRGPKGAAKELLSKLYFGAESRTAAKRITTHRIADGRGREALRDFLSNSFSAERVEAALKALLDD